MSVVEFLDAVEEPLKDEHIPPGKGHFIYTSLLGTASDLSTAENVQVTVSMLSALIENVLPVRCQSTWSRRTSAWGWLVGSKESSQQTRTG